MSPQKRRDHGGGSVYQRCEARFGCPPMVEGQRPEHACRGRWVATIEAGFTESGARRRITVTAKTEAAVKRKLRDTGLARDRGEIGTNPRETVKGWADRYLVMRLDDLSPKGYNASASPMRRWIIPTIGHKRLSALTPADLRAVADAQRNATDAQGKPQPRKPATIEATHRAMMTMLRYAVREGYAIPSRVMEAKPPPKAGKSDRIGMTVPEGLACIEQASLLPDGTRWLVTLLYGMRQGESLGLTWDAVNFDGPNFGEIIIEWQLQPLPYLDRADKRAGFRVPVGYEARHVVDSYHLVRPKSQHGYRVAPLLPPVRDGLLAWRSVAPTNDTGLVWPEVNGRPRNDKHDRAAWHQLQADAGVAHPSGRPYHVHECRNFAATMLLEAGIDEHYITSLLGHSSIVMSRKYMTVRREPLLAALTLVGERLQLG